MIDDTLSELSTGIEKAQVALGRELQKLRTGRAHPGMLDALRVDYFGTPTPISQMANIGVPEARMLTVKPWDKEQGKLIEKAIRESNMGFNPQSDGILIRIPIPPLSEERRKDLVKMARKMGEDCKVAIRKSRHDAMDMLDAIKKDGDASEDDVDRGKKKAEDIVGGGGREVDATSASKEKEILTV